MSTKTDLVPKLTKDQYALLRYFEQQYWSTGGLPTYDSLIRSDIQFDESLFYETLSSPRFLDGLRGRGIPEHVLTSGNSGIEGRTLTEQQLTVANVMLDLLDKRSRLKKLTELGVTTAEYNQWLRNPVYRNYCLARAESLLEENQPTAHTALIERVASGDLGAIKYFNSLTGRYREKNTAGVEVNLSQTNNYGTDTVIQLVEIIQRHVKDPTVLQLIADDILALQHMGNGAPRQEVTAEPLAVGSRGVGFLEPVNEAITLIGEAFEV